LSEHDYKRLTLFLSLRHLSHFGRVRPVADITPLSPGREENIGEPKRND
jgi:hypothetical protein